ncbi:MAG: amidohydrolase family protein [Flavobacteriales bacterium]
MARIINAHTHIFTGKFAPDYFFKVALPKWLHGWAEEIKALLEGKRMRWLIRGLSRSSGKSNMQRYLNFMETGMEQSQGDVFRQLRDAYATLGGDTRYIALTLNMDHMGPGSSNHAKIDDQLKEVEELRRDYPDHLFPFVCVDPRHLQGQALVDWVRPKIESLRFFGIKMYPALGFFPCDPRLMELYAWAEANNVPIMTHCTRAGVFYTGRLREVVPNDTAPCLATDASNTAFDPELQNINARLKKYMYNDFTSGKGQSKYGCNLFLNPRNFIPVLNRFKNLKVCFAHFGGDDEIMGDVQELTRKAIDPDNFHVEIKSLLANASYPNVYTDISYTLFSKRAGVYAAFKASINTPVVGDRVLFGTDYYMTLQEAPEPDLLKLCQSELGPVLFDKIATTNTNTYLASRFFPDPAGTRFV